MSVSVEIGEKHPVGESCSFFVSWFRVLSAGQAVIDGDFFPRVARATSKIDGEPSLVRSGCHEVQRPIFVDIAEGDVLCPDERVVFFILSGPGLGNPWIQSLLGGGIPVSLAISQIDEDALAMVPDDEVEAAVIVHISEGDATPAGDWHLQPARGLRPRALSVAEPDPCAFAQARQGR
jgi:hypothetical protein